MYLSIALLLLVAVFLYLYATQPATFKELIPAGAKQAWDCIHTHLRPEPVETAVPPATVAPQL